MNTANIHVRNTHEARPGSEVCQPGHYIEALDLVVGTTYWCNYWREAYTVLAECQYHYDHYGPTAVIVLTEDNEVVVHSTRRNDDPAMDVVAICPPRRIIDTSNDAEIQAWVDECWPTTTTTKAGA